MTRAGGSDPFVRRSALDGTFRRRSVVLVSDNNFAANQFTQFLLFAVRHSSQPGTPPAPALAGSSG